MSASRSDASRTGNKTDRTEESDSADKTHAVQRRVGLLEGLERGQGGLRASRARTFVSP